MRSAALCAAVWAVVAAVAAAAASDSSLYVGDLVINCVLGAPPAVLPAVSTAVDSGPASAAGRQRTCPLVSRVFTHVTALAGCMSLRCTAVPRPVPAPDTLTSAHSAPHTRPVELGVLCFTHPRSLVLSSFFRLSRRRIECIGRGVHTPHQHWTHSNTAPLRGPTPMLPPGHVVCVFARSIRFAFAADAYLCVAVCRCLSLCVCVCVCVSLSLLCLRVSLPPTHPTLHRRRRRHAHRRLAFVTQDTDTFPRGDTEGWATAVTSTCGG